MIFAHVVGEQLIFGDIIFLYTVFNCLSPKTTALPSWIIEPSLLQFYKFWISVIMFEADLLLCAKFFKRVWSAIWHTWDSPSKWMVFGTRAVQSLQLSQNFMFSKHYTTGWSVDMFSGASKPSEICGIFFWEEGKAVKLYSCSIAPTLFEIAGRSKSEMCQVLLELSKTLVLPALKTL